MPKLSHLKKSFDLLTLEEAVRVVRATRQDRVAYVPPKKKKKEVYALDGTLIESEPKAPRAPRGTGTRKPRAKKQPANTAQDVLNFLKSLPKEHRELMMEKLGIKK